MEPEAGIAAVFVSAWFGIIALSVCCSIASIVLWIWMLIDCLQNEPDEGNEKIVWILVIVLLQGIGALIYLLVRRPQRKRKYGA